MASEHPYRVRVVVDPAFGERLAKLAKDEPVWIIDTPLNSVVVQRLREQLYSSSHLTGITTFKDTPGLDAEETLLYLLDTIDLHHGEHSANPPYSILEVIGCTASKAISAALADLGFTVDTVGPDHFSARRVQRA
jgi:hypothetical protein